MHISCKVAPQLKRIYVQIGKGLNYGKKLHFTSKNYYIITLWDKTTDLTLNSPQTSFLIRYKSTSIQGGISLDNFATLSQSLIACFQLLHCVFQGDYEGVERTSVYCRQLVDYLKQPTGNFKCDWQPSAICHTLRVKALAIGRED